MTNEPERQENPGKYVIAGGVVFFFAYFIGGGLASSETHGQLPLPYTIGMLIIVFVTVFAASVVGAYYAGKRRR